MSGHLKILNDFADFLDRKAEEVTKFACGGCFYEASLAEINFANRSANADTISAEDVVTCPHCGEDMQWEKDDLSAQFYETPEAPVQETPVTKTASSMYLGLDDLNDGTYTDTPNTVEEAKEASEYIPPAGINVEKFNRYLTFPGTRA